MTGSAALPNPCVEVTGCAALPQASIWCAALLYGFGEASVAQEVAIWPPAAAGTESHATSLTVYQITQVARCATQPAAGGIT